MLHHNLMPPANPPKRVPARDTISPDGVLVSFDLRYNRWYYSIKAIALWLAL
ncbi:MAG: hypothetical protein LBU69_06870 [Deltaproteobacteria bacterium]|nr:hypothetical protein [Deltaproteobacteria bacterium]